VAIHSHPSRTTGWRYGIALIAVLALGLSSLVAFWRSGQPVVLPDVPAGKLACMSYTPRTILPGAPGGVTAAQMESDLAVLAEETRCVRTYSSTRGMEALPPIVRRHGMKMLLGIWIGTDEKSNEEEIAAALATVRDHADVIDGIIVGNEVLLRHEQSVEALRGFIDRVNQATDVPVTYADVWEFWRRNAELASSVDFITIHILPYWEDDPVGVSEALKHLRDVHAQMQQAFPGRRLLIGETGWPTKGRQREEARPGLVNAARFIREFVAYANGVDLPYNIIEAFDQPWKRANEGTVGGYWGLYSIDGRSKFPLQGPVVEDPTWQRGLGFAAVGALVLLVIGRIAGTARSLREAMLLAAIGIAAGALTYAQWRYLPAANRSTIEWLQSLAGALCGGLLVIGVGIRLARGLGGNGVPALSGGVDAFANPRMPLSTRCLAMLRLAFLFGVAYVCLGLAMDARFRDFPLALTALPALLLALQSLLLRERDRIDTEERMLSGVILLSVAVSAAIEGPHNPPALIWAASCGLLAGATLAAGRQAEPGQHQR
jgi:glucan 1,3-beta-glucosidase